jgi:hypothetical protein
MENGKETAEIGLVLRALRTLGLMVELREPDAERAKQTDESVDYRFLFRNLMAGNLRSDGVRASGEGRPSLTRGGKSLSASRGARKPPRRSS